MLVGHGQVNTHSHGVFNMAARLIRIAEAADLLGVSKWCLREWCNRELVPFNRTVNNQRVFTHELIAQIKNNMVENGNGKRDETKTRKASVAAGLGR